MFVSTVDLYTLNCNFDKNMHIKYRLKHKLKVKFKLKYNDYVTCI